MLNHSKEYTPAQAAAQIGCCELTVRRKMKAGELPFTKSDGRVRIAGDDLKAFVEKRALPGIHAFSKALERVWECA